MSFNDSLMMFVDFFDGFLFLSDAFRRFLTIANRNLHDFQISFCVDGGRILMILSSGELAENLEDAVFSICRGRKHEF